MIQCLRNCKGGLEYEFWTNRIKDIMAKTELQKKSVSVGYITISYWTFSATILVKMY